MFLISKSLPVTLGKKLYAGWCRASLAPSNDNFRVELAFLACSLDKLPQLCHMLSLQSLWLNSVGPVIRIFLQVKILKSLLFVLPGSLGSQLNKNSKADCVLPAFYGVL